MRTFHHYTALDKHGCIEDLLIDAELINSEGDKFQAGDYLHAGYTDLEYQGTIDIEGSSADNLPDALCQAL